MKMKYLLYWGYLKPGFPVDLIYRRTVADCLSTVDRRTLNFTHSDYCITPWRRAAIIHLISSSLISLSASTDHAHSHLPPRLPLQKLVAVPQLLQLLHDLLKLLGRAHLAHLL